MARSRIVTGGNAKADQASVIPKPARSEIRPNHRIRFAFAYFRQIELFGIDGVSPSWFTSLLERLHQLSSIKIDRLFFDRSMASANRFHNIDWNAYRCPISKDTLDWIPASYRDNSDEFPLMQLHISKANGRLVGFFDEDWVFQIVLLDPLHNIQPSKYNSYHVDPISPAFSNYHRIMQGIREVIQKAECQQQNCRVIDALSRLPGSVDSLENQLIRLPDDYAKEAAALIADGKASTLDEIFAFGLLFCSEAKS